MRRYTEAHEMNGLSASKFELLNLAVMLVLCGSILAGSVALLFV